MIKHPYQRIALASVPSDSGLVSDVLLAAAGPTISAFDFSTGSFLSRWPPSYSDPETHAEKKVSEDDNQNGVDSEGASKVNKRRKLSHETTPKYSTILDVAVSPDARYVVATSDVDKCVRVFQLSTDGQMTLFSERVMPKRPCTLAISPAGDTIFCGDKFGDVYALPLPGPAVMAGDSVLEKNGTATSSSPLTQPIHTSTPLAANEKTVHTGKNRNALKNQLEAQNSRSQRPATRTEHVPILGHVSMLTGILAVFLEAPEHTRKPRLYILTSDRDEHIRVSRGPPQSHTIEGYCFGHQTFVSKICVAGHKSEFLISGDGDGLLCVWDWVTGRLLQKLDTATLGQGARDVIDRDKSKAALPKRPVSLIYRTTAAFGQSVLSEHDIDISQSQLEQVIIGLERSPSLYILNMSESGHLSHQQTIELLGNALDVAIGSKNTSFVVTIDNLGLEDRETPKDTTKQSTKILAQCFSMVWVEKRSIWQDVEQSSLQSALADDGGYQFEAHQFPGLQTAIKDRLYHLTSLRKQEVELIEP